jgi:hypothetical protein
MRVSSLFISGDLVSSIATASPERVHLQLTAPPPPTYNNTSSVALRCSYGTLAYRSSVVPEPRERSRCTDRLQAGRPRVRSSSPASVKNFLFVISSRPVLGPTQPPMKWAMGAFSPDITLTEVKTTWVYRTTPPYVLLS